MKLVMAEMRLLGSLEKNGKQVVDEDGNGTGGSYFGVEAHTALGQVVAFGRIGRCFSVFLHWTSRTQCLEPL